MLHARKSASVGWALVFWVLAVGWVVVLFFFSGQSAIESGSLSGRLTAFLMRRLYFIDISKDAFEHLLRKLAHFGIFAVEGFFLRTALFHTRSRRHINTVISAGVMLAVAVANELFQLTASGRGCSVRDMFIDFSGALTGILFSALLCWISESVYIRKRYARVLRRGERRVKEG